MLLLSVSRNSFQTQSSDDTCGKFYMVKFNYFSGRPNKVKQRFEIFLIDHYAGYIGNKNISGT